MFTKHQNRRSQINLGDLAKVLNCLPNASKADQEYIANCLGFQTNDTAITKSQPTRSADREQTKTPAPIEYQAKLRIPRAPQNQATALGDILATDFDELPPSNEQSTILTKADIDNALVLAQTPYVKPITRQTLIPQNKARAILSASVMQITTGQNIDIPKLIKTMVCRQNLPQLPMLKRFTARNGCQLLLDFSETLMPWWQDMQALNHQFHQLFSEQLCPAYSFEGDPGLATRWKVTGEIKWHPETNRPVIIASDLGILRSTTSTFRPSSSVWFEFANYCKQRNIPVIVFTPLKLERCPAGLDKIIKLIHWHPAMSISSIKHLIMQSPGNSR